MSTNNSKPTQLESEEMDFFGQVFEEDFDDAEKDQNIIDEEIAGAPEFSDEENDTPYLIQNPDDQELDAEFEDESEEGKQPAPQVDESVDFIKDILASKGIEDPTKINYEDENGELVEVNFYELPYEEQIEILKSSDSDIDFGLSDHEVETVNILRHHGVTLDQLVDYYSAQAVQDYIQNQSADQYEVDSFTDDELFVLDLKSKYADLTNEDILATIEHEKKNENLFKRKIEFLRTSYKEAEDLNKQQELEAENKSKAEKEKEKADSLIEGSKSLVDIGGLDLEDEERDSTLKYILEKDITGKTEFEKAMDNPEAQFKMAWFIKHGDTAFEILHNYYKNEIDKVRKTTYDKAKEEFSKKAAIAVRKQAEKQQPSVTVRGGSRPTKSNIFGTDYVDQDDLFARSFKK